MHSNYIELLGYYGGDRNHLMSPNREQVLETSKNIIHGTFQNYIKNGRTEPFKLSNIHFKLITEYNTFYFFKGFLKNVITIEESDKIYIPRELCNVKTSEIIKDHNENNFNKEGDYYYDLLYNYSELGKSIIKSIQNLPSPKITQEGKRSSMNFLKNFYNQIHYEIIMDFEEFYFLLQKYEKEPISMELRNIIDIFIDTINQLKNVPFTNTMKAFNQYTLKKDY